MLNGGPGNWFIQCTNCKCTTNDVQRDRAVELWNTRATLQPDGERREAIARIIYPMTGRYNTKLYQLALEKADRILASGFVQNEAGIRDGYVLVPIVPTQEMLDAGYWPCVQRRGAKSVWAAMIAAIRSARDGGEE